MLCGDSPMNVVAIDVEGDPLNRFRAPPGQSTRVTRTTLGDLVGRVTSTSYDSVVSACNEDSQLL